MIRLEEDIIKIQKKFNLLDEKIKKDYIVENFNKLFDLALEKNIALKSGFPTLKLIFTETPKNNEIPIECLEVYSYLLTTYYNFGNIQKLSYDKDKKSFKLYYLVTEYNNQINTYKSMANAKIKYENKN